MTDEIAYDYGVMYDMDATEKAKWLATGWEVTGTERRRSTITHLRRPQSLREPLPPMSDTERLDRLQALLRSKKLPRTVVVLGSWWSGGDEPDGYSANVGECEVDGAEHTSLRDAIDDAIASDPEAGYEDAQ